MNDRSKRAALGFVVLLGVVSLFADVTYEGARGVSGPFLATLGAGAAAVGLAAGLGELVGYALRLVSGVVSDRTRAYWTITFVGYGLNLIAVPALALAGRWEVAAGLIVLERLGKAIRSPARDAILADAADRVGHGKAFGLHEALDQIGAVVGPLFLAFVFARDGGYRLGFALLAIPAALALAALVAARVVYGRGPADGAPAKARFAGTRGLGGAFWLYIAAAGLMAAGFADFPIVAYHVKRAALLPDGAIPGLYAAAMAADALSALVFGALFDRRGIRCLALAALLAAAAAPLLFLAGSAGVVAGMILWGCALGAHESVLRAAIASMVPAGRRAAAYGLFYAGYGACWFAGSVAIGALADWSAGAVVVFVVAAQCLALPPLFAAARRADAAA